jgi:4-cresol dehydrogenase (hydroxylating)
VSIAELVEPTKTRRGNMELFLREVEELVGAEHVVKDEPKLSELSVDPVCTAVPPTAFIYPGSKEELIEIVRAANKYSVVLWPYSTGKNWGYLNTSNDRDSVVVILSRMNRILHVDYELAFAEIEPGVTYEQLNNYLRENNIALWTDCTGGPPSGSVLGNALDRGIGVTPSGDHFANLCGLEVVMPTGEVIRTGGYGDDAKGAWHTYKWGIGPSLEGLFAQSNLGIVTKAGIWLMRKPKDMLAGALRVEEGDSLAAALDEVRELMLDGVIPEKARFSNDVAIFTLITQAINEGLEDKPLSKSARAALREKYCVPAWTGSFGIYGTKQHVKVTKTEVTSRLARRGRLTFVGESRARRAKKLAAWMGQLQGTAKRIAEAALRRTYRTSLPALRLVPELLQIHQGIPNESVVRRAYFRYRKPRPTSNIHVARDRLGVLWFVPTLPFRGKEIEKYVSECEPYFANAGLDFYVTIMILNARTAVPLMVILYDLDDEDSCRRAKGLYDKLYDDALLRGYQQFRCALPGWNRIYLNHSELCDVYRGLKYTLDPNQVIAPGRYGVG